MGEAVTRWLADLERMGRSPRTVTAYRERLATLERQHPTRDVTQLTRDDLQRWVDGRGGPASRAAHRSTARAFWSWMVDEGLAATNVALGVRAPTVRAGRPRPVPPDALAKAVTAADARMRAALLLGALAGLRVAEMAALRWEHVDLAAHELTVQCGKGGRDRVVPLAAELETALLALGSRRRAAVLEPAHGGHYTPRELGTRIARHLRAHGADCTAHQLRHSFASAVYAVTRDIQATAMLLGHASPATTAVYARFDVDDTLRLRLRALGVA